MFASFFKRSKKENRTLVEHKLYLAKETPEPIFDLSECCINNVPTGIYSLCKVFRKEVLNLSHNHLDALNGGGQLSDLSNLLVLHLNHNNFTCLPSEMQVLRNLKELYLDGNRIKKLPYTLCTLQNLQILSINNNALYELPADLGLLQHLRFLAVEGNPKLKMLPKSLHKAHRLNEIKCDCDVIVYPPREILDGDIDVMMKYLCEEVGCDCYKNKTNRDDLDNASDANDRNYSSHSFHIEAKIWNLEKIKEQKQRDFLAIERGLLELKQQELDVANLQKVDKEKLLAELSYEQGHLNQTLDKIQHDRDADRFKLIEQLKETEDSATQAIQQLLQINTKPPAFFFEQELREHEELLKAANEDREVKKAQILNDMQQLLINETVKFIEIDLTRVETTKSILAQEVESSAHIMNVLQCLDNRNKELTETLQKDDELQRIAVAGLLEKSDVRSWSLVQQVMLVESQLAALTRIEMDRRKLEVDHNLNDLAQQRVELSTLLLDLLEQQNIRRGELMSTLQDLELMNEDRAEDFWIRQYQHLLDRMPNGLMEWQRNIDTRFVELLLMHGVLNYLPLLAKLPQIDAAIQESDIEELGIRNQNDKKRIMNVLADYLKYDKKVEPSAPNISPTMEASAPSHSITFGNSESECVICMDEKCQVVYIPCGHYCSCFKCSSTITDCPMCRASITRIIKVD